MGSWLMGMVGLVGRKRGVAGSWAKLVNIRVEYRYAGKAMLAGFGVDAAGESMVDVVFMLGLGLIGFRMRRYGIPLAPVRIAVILGPLAESSLRAAMNNSQNDPMTLISTPITITLYILLVIVITISAVNKVRIRKAAGV